MLIKFSLLFFTSIILLNFFTKSNSTKLKGDEDEEYGQALDAVIEAYNKSKQLYSTKQVNYFSDHYSKIDDKDISLHTANLMKGDESSTKSFHKLNSIANKLNGADKRLKINPQLTNTLKIMLNDNSMKMKDRVNAAKLVTRLTDLPVTIQMVSDNPEKKPENIDSHIIVPRIKRIYRPDYYVENYKAGNWDA
jgi:hypothetical protein